MEYRPTSLAGAQAKRTETPFFVMPKAMLWIKKNTKEQFYPSANKKTSTRLVRRALAPIECALMIVIGSLHSTSQGQQCQPVEASSTNGTSVGGVIPSGKYCLASDLGQPKEFDLHAMRFKTFVGAPILNIFCPSWHRCQRSHGKNTVELDLQGHRLKADVGDMMGVKDSIPTQHIYLHNGTVIVPGNSDANVGIDLQAMYSPRETYARMNCNQAGVKCGNGQLDMVTKEAPLYQETRHTVEKVKVRAGWMGVQMVGIGNTLRNSVIEVESRGAIALFGFTSIIENNTIIVHGKAKPTADDGALALWDGNGAVIRNNRFIFKGRPRQAPPAIRLIDSANVRLEGNTCEGFSQIVEETGKSSYSEKK